MSSTIYAANKGETDSSSALAKKGDEKILDRIRKRNKYHVQAWRRIRQEGAADVQALSPLGPWDPTERKNRKDAGRPCIHLDQLTQYTNGFIGEVRQNPIAIKVNPAGGGATDESASLLGDRIRQIEYESNGTQATMTALENAVERSYGAFGLMLEYVSWDSDELRVKFRRFANPDAISWDPDCKEADWSDMQDAFVHDWMPWDTFEEKYGDATATNFAEGQGVAPDWINVGAQMVQVSEYWCIEKTKRTILWLEDGSSPKGRRVFRDELPEGAQIKGPAVIYADGTTQKILSRRDTEQPKVMQYLTNGLQILDRMSDTPGTQIPIFPITGKERFVPDIDDGAGSTRVRRMLFSQESIPKQQKR